MMKIAYFDCFAGAAGDMIAAAMLDAGLDREYLLSQLATLAIDDLSVSIDETSRRGQRALTFRPAAPDQHHHRHLSHIVSMINSSGISPAAKDTAIAIFTTLGRAEARVHGTTIDHVHFHEVGAIDSIVDIVSAAIGFHALGIQKLYASTLSVGGGTIKAAHGVLSAPAPATVEILREASAPIQAGPVQMELLTPTAAAILATLVDGFGPLPAMTVEAIGCGAGTADPEKMPNVLRLFIGHTAENDSQSADTVCLMEANIDDVTGEQLGAAFDMLLAAGALDVFTTPITMKRNRPAVKLSVLCAPADIVRIESLIFSAGLTVGMRKQLIERIKLPREFRTAQTPYGPIRVKLAFHEGRIVSAKPEFADCAAAAEKHAVPVAVVRSAAEKSIDL